MAQEAKALQFQPVAKLEQWVSIAWAANLEAVSPREVRNRISEGKYESRKTGEKAKNHKPIREVAVNSLSPAAQARYLAQLKDRAQGIAIESKPTAKPVSTERLRGAAVPLTVEGTPDVQAMRKSGRDTEADMYLERVRAVSRVLAVLDGAKYGQTTRLWKSLAIELSTPESTLRAWVKKYQKGGASALVPGYGHNRGHYSALPQGLQRAILASWRQQQRQTVRQIMKHTVRPWCATHGHAVPHRTTVGRFIEKEVAAAERAAFRVGKRGWEEQIMIKVTRSPEDLAINDLWCADHRKLDVFVYAPDGHRVIRPWVTMYADIATAGLVGWCLRDRPNSQSVALALRSGIMRFGTPKALYHDNGKEFIARRFGGKAKRRTRRQNEVPRDCDIENVARWPALMPASLETVYGKALFATLGIERVINALPYSSWSKPIESHFHAFHRQWENLMPGYCGNSPKGRPEKCVREIKEGRLLHWEQFAEIYAKSVEDWNANHVCGDRKRTPAQYYEAAQGELRFVTEDTLDMMLLRAQRRKVTPQGIEIGGKHFLDDGLAWFVGEYVEVLYDPDDLSAIIVRPERNPNKRIVVTPVPHAGWFDYSEANTTALHLRRLQREQLKAVAVADREHLVPEYVDPTGANRLAVRNAQDRKASQRAESAARSTGIIAEMKAQAQLEAAEAKKEKAERRAARSGIAAQIAEQARTEEAYRKGESA